MATHQKDHLLVVERSANLVPTQIVEPEIITLSNGKKFSADYMRGLNAVRQEKALLKGAKLILVSLRR